MAKIPAGLEPYLPPVPEFLHPELSLVLSLIGFCLFSWLFVVLLTTKEKDRNALSTIVVAGCISVVWGFAGLFGLLWAGLNV
mmetsp:Transcript_21578/g.39472  ORF Transcript_21578/g.39472 Transcript_21578/m.39472 type:complete len:82 (-) Transcript_21578:29-274(-)